MFFTRTAGTYTSDSAMISASIELTPAAAIAVHNTSTTAHNDIRSDVSTVEDRLDALDGVEIEAYSSTATYSRGSANSIVTHTNGLFIYISSTERSSGHDPDTQPGYWLRLSEGVAYEVITSGSHRIAARTIVVNGDNDNVYLCTTTQTTPRDLDYIHAQSETTGGSFILLNGGGTGGGFTLRSGFNGSRQHAWRRWRLVSAHVERSVVLEVFGGVDFPVHRYGRSGGQRDHADSG